jgi:hypothetical protein
MDLPLPGQQSLPFPPRTPSGSEENLLNSPISNDQLPMYYGGYNPPGSANAAQPASPVNRAPSPPSEQLGLPLEEHPRTGYTLRELVDSTRRAGKEASPSFHGGSKLNKAPTYATEAQSELYQAGKKLVNSEFDKSIEHGYADPSDVATRRSANTKFSTLATVAPNVAKQANQANRAAARPASGNDTIFGAQKRIAHGLLDRATGGVNSQYAIGQGLEGVGTAAEAGSQLARLGAGLGWTNPDQEHPEMAKVVSENPQAPKAAVEAKTNDKMKQSLMGSWYTSLVDTAKGLFD